MAVLAELFTATHAAALRRADDLDAGDGRADVPRLEVPGVTPLELEQLGEIAARAVRFGAGDLELEDVDLEHDGLFRLPRFLREVLLELRTHEDPEVLPEVAREWAATEEMAAGDEDLSGVVRGITDVVQAAEDAGREVYLWVQGA